MRKFAKISAVLAAMVFALAGCKNDSSSSGDDEAGVVTKWYSNDLKKKEQRWLYFYDDGTVKMTRTWTETVYDYDKLGNSNSKEETKSIVEAVGTYTGKTTESEIDIIIVINKITKDLLYGGGSDDLEDRLGSIGGTAKIDYRYNYGWPSDSFLYYLKLEIKTLINNKVIIKQEFKKYDSDSQNSI